MSDINGDMSLAEEREFERREAAKDERRRLAREANDQTPANFVDIVFDGPPGPQTGRFVEVENERGESIRLGEWVQRSDGFWALRIQREALRLDTEGA